MEGKEMRIMEIMDECDCDMDVAEQLFYDEITDKYKTDDYDLAEAMFESDYDLEFGDKDDKEFAPTVNKKGNDINYLNELDVLYGFKFIEAYETLASDNSTVTIFKFVNDKNVAIEIIFIGDEWRLGEPYAVDDEYLPLKKKEVQE